MKKGNLLKYLDIRQTHGFMANFSQQLIEAVWKKAKEISGYDPNVWRQDFAGAWISHSAYGQQGPFGWEIDHLKPVVLNGSDDIENLNPLQWQNNRTKGDDYPQFKTSVTSSINTNVEKVQSWRVK